MGNFLKTPAGRQAGEKKRYMTLYGVDVEDLSPFDLVVDTAPNTLEQVVRIVAEKYKEWIRK